MSEIEKKRKLRIKGMYGKVIILGGKNQHFQKKSLNGNRVKNK